jgi:hypothetical protein
VEGPAVDLRRPQRLMEAPPSPLSSRVVGWAWGPPKETKNTFGPEQPLSMEALPVPLSSRAGDGPQAACGPPKEMKNTLRPATALHGSVAFPFVIPRVCDFIGFVTFLTYLSLLFQHRFLYETNKVTDSERSRGICGSADLSWKCFRQSAAEWICSSAGSSWKCFFDRVIDAG